MFKILLWCFLIYMVYRFVFELVLPISKKVGEIKKTMASMQQQQPYQQTNSNFQQQHTQQQSAPNNTSTPKKADYIDFEEIK